MLAASFRHRLRLHRGAGRPATTGPAHGDCGLLRPRAPAPTSTPARGLDFLLVLQGVSRRVLLRVLLAAAATLAPDLAADDHLDRELLLVLRSDLLSYAVDRMTEALGLHVLLQ